MAAELEELFAICNRKSYRSTLRLALEQGPTVPLICVWVSAWKLHKMVDSGVQQPCLNTISTYAGIWRPFESIPSIRERCSLTSNDTVLSQGQSKVRARSQASMDRIDLNYFPGMELCHARYDFEHISYIHIWLQQVLLDYTGRPAEDNLRLLDNLRSDSILGITVFTSGRRTDYVTYSNNVEPKKWRCATSNAWDTNINLEYIRAGDDLADFTLLTCIDKFSIQSFGLDAQLWR